MVDAKQGPKVFGIGLSRTGTTSLTRALVLLGYHTKHFPSGLDDILAHEACTDISVAALFKELDRGFPGSKFILTTRDKTAWLNSMSRHTTKYETYIQDSMGMADLYEQVYGADTFNEEKYSAAYDRHEKSVHAYFRDRPGDLLVMNITDGDGWDALCPFLGVPTPQTPFSNSNNSTLYDGLIIRLMKNTNSLDWIVKVTDVSMPYLEDLLQSDAFASHDPSLPLPLDDGDDFTVCIKRAGERYPTAQLARILNISEKELARF